MGRMINAHKMLTANIIRRDKITGIASEGI
jgi:hypothetical protein